MANEIEQLMEMGFPRNRAEKALAKTNNRGVEPAMEWLFAHSEDADIDEAYTAPQGHVLGKAEDQAAATPEVENMDTSAAATGEEAAAGQAASLKCDDCGKLLRTELDAQAHASRSGHSNFSETTEVIKPLTEEEKKVKAKEVQDRLALRRKEKEVEDRQDALKKEKARRNQGKQISDIKYQHEQNELKKMAEEKKREKEDERKAKEKVKAEIEKDKRDRIARNAKTATSPAAAAAAAPAPAVQQPKKTYDQCRLQIRLTNGQAITNTFGVKEELAAVRLWVQTNRTDGAGPFTLMTSFPKKLFTDEDMCKPLNDLGLVPSAVLIVTKAQ